MAPSIEFLVPDDLSHTGSTMLEALLEVAQKEGVSCQRTKTYVGGCDWLMLYGVGHVERAPVRDLHFNRGGRVFCWDVGYFGRKKLVGYLRVSIDTDHPQHWLDKTPEEPTRWDTYNIQLREDYNAKGPIILVGLGPKSRVYLGPNWEHWELGKLRQLRERFPNRKIIFRPKPRRPYPHLPGVHVDAVSPIEDVLRGTSLVVCRHSNVAVDAAIAGVPFETYDGAGVWLNRREFTVENRLSFLRRLSWWQWSVKEAPQAWAFLSTLLKDD